MHKNTNRVISYIDGFNFYFGLRSKGWRTYYWLDYAALTRAYVQNHQTFMHCHYFTARISDRPGSNGQSAQNQKLWLEAVESRSDTTCHYGQYLTKKQQCKSCGASWTSHEEKMTDVNIATQLILDAYDDKFDTAIIMSGDSDLTTPIKMLRERFENKRFVVAFPPGRESFHLGEVATAHIYIRKNKLRKSLLPDILKNLAGYEVKRPDAWR